MSPIKWLLVTITAPIWIPFLIVLGVFLYIVIPVIVPLIGGTIMIAIFYLFLKVVQLFT